MFTLYRNDRKLQFPWQFEIVMILDSFEELVKEMFSLLCEDTLRIEVDYTENFAEIYTEYYIYVIK